MIKYDHCNIITTSVTPISVISSEVQPGASAHSSLMSRLTRFDRTLRYNAAFSFDKKGPSSSAMTNYIL